MHNLLFSLGLLLASSIAAVPAHALTVKQAVLRVDDVVSPPISRLDIKPQDLGFAGAKLGNQDNQTTGSFTGVDYQLITKAVPPDQALAAFKALKAEGVSLVTVLADAKTLAALSAEAGDGMLLINAGARDDALRNEACMANVLDVAPSRSMLTDAVMQFLVWKKWTKVMLVTGSHPEDKLLADAYRKSIAKFGATIVEEREFVDTGGARRTDTGQVLVQRQIPVFMQNAAEHDIVVAADEADVFAAYLPYHSWDPRPVAGSAGLRPVSWHPAQEAWGATQFQNRFEKLNGRPMREEDYQAWLAMRVIGEAVTRTGKADPQSLRAYVLSDKFDVAAFKGQKLTFRPWDGQLRQPILLADGRITVSVSPQEGFLHQVSPLDTLGIDRPESKCRAFGG